MSLIPRNDLTFTRVGKGFVVRPTSPTKYGWKWLIRCDCGSLDEKTVAGINVAKKRGGGLHCKECGVAARKHGGARKGKKPSSYTTWENMKARCYRESRPEFIHYGARGIKICERWHEYENFLADMGEPPKGMSMDRVDNNGDYSPENCRWADQQTQVSNRRTKSNTGVTGISFHKVHSRKTQSYRFVVKYMYKSYGQYKTMLDAYAALMRAKKVHNK